MLRQGDLYAVESRSDTPSGAIPGAESHHWDARTRYCTHRPADGNGHRPLRVGYRVRFVPQRVYGMGRGAGRVAGD